LSAKIDIFCWV